MKDKGNTPILTNLERNIHIKYEANPCSGSREEVEKPKKFTPTTKTTTTTTTTETGSHSLKMHALCCFAIFLYYILTK